MYKVASVDIETLGLNSDNCSIIEFGCVLDDYVTPLADLPRYRRLLFPEDWIFKGEPYAMAMNHKILKAIDDWKSGNNVDDQNQTIPETQLDESFSYFLKRNAAEDITIVGKNFANFDLLFLKKIGFGEFSKYHRRILDVGSLFYDPRIDKHVPGLDECLKRSKIEKQVEHTSIEDALDVLKCVRFKYGY
jgi:oligoribonuclease (3'-5' exoribonuclease)